MTREKAWHVDRETYVQQYVVGIVAGIMSIVLVLYWIVDTRRSGVLPSTGKGIVISATGLYKSEKTGPLCTWGFVRLTVPCQILLSPSGSLAAGASLQTLLLYL